MRWETSTRFYMATVQLDLLGDWQVHRMWGAIHSGQGGSLVELATDERDAERRLLEVERTRLRRGYKPAPHTSNFAAPLLDQVGPQLIERPGHA